MASKALGADLVEGVLVLITGYLVIMLLAYFVKGRFHLTTDEFELPERMADILLSSAILVPILPALGMAALLLRIEGHGPAFSKEKRSGFRRQPFRLLRLRTAPEDAIDRTGSSLAERLLSKTGVARWPGLFNVLLGDIRMFGPRPLPHELEEKFIADYPRRFSIRPGLISVWDVEQYDLDFRSLKLVRRSDMGTMLKVEDAYFAQASLSTNALLLMKLGLLTTLFPVLALVGALAWIIREK